MNNPAIHNYETFKAEKARLHALFDAQKQIIAEDINNLKEEIEPVNEILGVAKMLTRRDHSLGLLGKAVDVIVDFLVKKVFFRKAGWLMRILVAFLAKNLVSKFAGDKAKEAYPEITKLLKKTA